MKVGELIKQLQQYPKDLDVLITDGYRCLFYGGDYVITLFEDELGAISVDIGIGGMESEDV